MTTTLQAPPAPYFTTANMIDHLGELRRDVAERTRAIAHRELDHRTLRAELEQRHHRGNKTEAEKHAKADPENLAFERQTIEMTFERDEVMAQAEGLRLHILDRLRADRSGT